MTKVFVSGCFDVLHSGHIAFLETAATYGDLYVSIGSDKTVTELKNKRTVYTENERLYMITALRCVTAAYIARGTGVMDFAELLEKVKPDILFVNADGDSPQKRAFIESKGIQYIVQERVPHEDLPVRSTSAIRLEIKK